MAATHTLIFDSVAECLDDANDGKVVNSANRAFYERIRDRPKDSWYGLRTPADAAGIQQLINNGWTEGAGKIQRQADSVEVTRLPSVRRRRVRGDNGDAIDMDRVYAGALDTAWTRTAKASSSNPPRVHVVVNLSANCNRSGDSLFWRGAAALALSARLVEAGYVVQLSAVFSTTAYDESGARALVSVVVKSYRAPLEINSMAATTALAGFMRAILFMQIIKHCPNKVCDSLGYAAEVKPHEVPDCAANFTFVAHELWSADDARKFIKSSLDTLTQQPQAA